MSTALHAITPVDGRYASKTAELTHYFSEFALIKYRVRVEIEYFIALCETGVEQLAGVDSDVFEPLRDIYRNFQTEDAQKIKDIEKVTNHDVKAVEYFIKERMAEHEELDAMSEFVHFACTSEDINNLSYALMLRSARKDALAPQMRSLRLQIANLAREYADIPMLSRTHGQTASPTTVGKEFMNVVHRLKRAEQQFSSVEILGKFNGAVGNFNAHLVAYPDADWQRISRRFVESLGLEHNSHTTQIEPHDWTAEYSHAVMRYNTVLLDFCRDVWGYISLGYFKQKLKKDEVGSSTMPHKVNPIDFENAEGNLGMSNALLGHFADKLPISRWQRDLTDSTVQRNFGVALGYTVIAIQAALKGVGKLELNRARLDADIDEAWEVLGEAVQTVMRRYGIPEPYEKLKALTRGQDVTRDVLAAFVGTLDIPDAEKDRLLALTPATYVGLAAELAKEPPA